jgi:hypothetical protein
VPYGKFDHLKKSISRELQQVKHSHRLEALARGLSWNTYAAMKAEVFDFTPTVQMDGSAFTEYLEAHGYQDIDAGILEQAVRRVLTEVPAPDAELDVNPAISEFDEEDVTDIFFRR